MSNSRFVVGNLLETSTLKNGTGGGAPARDETFPFTMERVQTADRRSKWLTAATPANPSYSDWDLGSAKTVSALAALGIRSLDPAQTLTVNVYSASVYGTWNFVAVTATGAGRDLACTFGSTVARYWRAAFYGGVSQFSVGRIVVGALTDLGLIADPGDQSSPFQNRLEQVLQDGSYNVNSLGDDGRNFTLTITCTDTMLDQLEALAAARASLLFFDSKDRVHEVLITGGRASVTRTFNGRYEVTLEMVRLP